MRQRTMKFNAKKFFLDRINKMDKIKFCKILSKTLVVIFKLDFLCDP
jgi:hypothetical protein